MCLHSSADASRPPSSIHQPCSDDAHRRLRYSWASWIKGMLLLWDSNLLVFPLGCQLSFRGSFKQFKVHTDKLRDDEHSQSAVNIKAAVSREFKEMQVLSGGTHVSGRRDGYLKSKERPAFTFEPLLLMNSRLYLSIARDIFITLLVSWAITAAMLREWQKWWQWRNELFVARTSSFENDEHFHSNVTWRLCYDCCTTPRGFM